MIPASAPFIAAQNSDANLPVSKVQLVLGNYASAPANGSSAAASSELSTDWPASGAIDGDRTEINVGPASGADNDTGQSSWQSAVAPDTTPQTLTVTFTQPRTFNRIKLYNRDGHGSKTYYYQWWDGTAWNTFAATSDIVAPGQTSIVPTNKLDVVDFPDVTTAMLRLTIVHTQVAAENAQVVELEVYRLLDITARVKDIAVSRTRDYKLANPMAASLTLTVANDDRFFSLNHAPTAAEAAAGFINGELDANIGVVVALGFNYFAAAPETPSVFIGFVDRITTKPVSRDAVLAVRDGTKVLINRIDSTKLRAGQDISQNIQYLLERSNISDFEMSLDVTGIAIDFFFTEAENVLTSIRNLVEAAVDAAFFFDESGMATFRFYAGNVPLSKLFTTQADWQSGMLTSVDALTIPGDILVDFATMDARQATTYGNSLAGWTPQGNWTDNLGTNLEVMFDGIFGPQPKSVIRRDLATGSGRWEFTFKKTKTNTLGDPRDIFFMFQVHQLAVGEIDNSGYAVRVDEFDGGHFQILRLSLGTDPTVDAVLADVFMPQLNDNQDYTVIVTKNPEGVITATLVGVAGPISATDTTFPTGNHLVIYLNVTGEHTGDNVFFGDLPIYAPAVSEAGVWVSPPINTGVTTSAYNTVADTHVLNGGTIGYETRSSSDGLTWNAYLAVGGGGAILSPILQYLQVRATLTSPSLAANDNPDVLDVTVSWFGSATSKKYPSPPSSFTFRFDSTLLDVSQELADNLGGDSAIVNDTQVQAQPLVLTGANTDTVWQATVGTPPVNVSGTDPITVTTGQVLTIAPAVSGGMDISFMSGADPAAAVVVFGGGATGSWEFSSIHPTLPVLKITVTNGGTITDLRLVGQTFTSAQYLQVQVAQDLPSISRYGDRQLQISNPWIVSVQIAAQIAQTILSNFRAPTSYIPSCTVRPTFNAQIGDRITVVDANLDLDADYIAVGVAHKFAVNMTGGAVQTDFTLLKVPLGD